MIVILLYPPAQLIGETEDLQTVEDELVRVVAEPGQTERVRFAQLGILSYTQDRFGRTLLMVQGLGPYKLRGDSWAAWRKPTSDELRAWDKHRAAVAGILTPEVAKRPESC
jgi:hypothetical protein